MRRRVVKIRVGRGFAILALSWTMWSSWGFYIRSVAEGLHARPHVADEASDVEWSQDST